MRLRAWQWLLVLLTVTGGLLAGRPLAAQTADVAVLDNAVEVEFPHQVTFRLQLNTTAGLSEATLNYRLGRQSCLEAFTQVPVELDGDTLEWVWVMSRSGNPPPGAQVTWSWSLTTTDGQTVTTPVQSFTFQDDRFSWRTVSATGPAGADRIRLNWYEGDQVGPLLLDAAVAGLDRLEDDIGIELEGTVQFFIYASSEDMQQALLYVQDWAGGVAFADYNTILIGVPPRLAESWGRRTVRHELAHLVLDQFGLSCVGGSRPTWLEDGLAEYAEGEPDEETEGYLAQALEENAFSPVRSLNGAFPADPDRAGLAYSQSYSLVNFLLDRYGAEAIRELLRRLADAEPYDAALEQVYGFNADGLERAWREAIGAPPRTIPPTPTPLAAAAVPTYPPLAGVQAVPTPAELAPAPAATATPSSEDGLGGAICG
ncbi:MAG: peptidase MA family metallohydrolase, partial [Candidatus Promineifilaceae bacterium]|nr:peptidase MA family metallohydrolase [Candidatus Promineifilaceae bacterium]